MSFLDRLRPPPPTPLQDRFTRGVVTDDSPVTVRLDSDPTAETPVSTRLVAVTVGDTVWCQFHGRQLIILGKVQP